MTAPDLASLVVTAEQVVTKSRFKCEGSIPAHWIEFGDGDRFWLRTEYWWRWDCTCGDWNVLPGSEWARESFEDHVFDLCPLRGQS